LIGILRSLPLINSVHEVDKKLTPLQFHVLSPAVYHLQPLPVHLTCSPFNFIQGPFLSFGITLVYTCFSSFSDSLKPLKKNIPRQCRG
jgi:hypothetical protein